MQTNNLKSLLEWRELATAAVGESSPAIDFIDRKITAKGAKAEISCDENHFILMCSHLDAAELSKDERPPTTGKSIRDTLRALSRESAADHLLADDDAGASGGVKQVFRELPLFSSAV